MPPCWAPSGAACWPLSWGLDPQSLRFSPKPLCGCGVCGWPHEGQGKIACKRREGQGLPRLPFLPLASWRRSSLSPTWPGSHQAATPLWGWVLTRSLARLPGQVPLQAAAQLGHLHRQLLSLRPTTWSLAHLL